MKATTEKSGELIEAHYFDLDDQSMLGSLNQREPGAG